MKRSIFDGQTLCHMNTKKLGISATLAAGLFSATTARALPLLSPYLELEGMPTLHQDVDSGTVGGGSTSSASPGMETRFGYEVSATAGVKFFRYLVLGATYSMEKNPFSQQNLAAGTGASSSPNPNDLIQGNNSPEVTTVTSNEWGPSVGLVIGGLHLIGTYYITGTKNANDVVTPNPSSGNSPTNNSFIDSGAHGYQLDIGYSFMILPHVAIGPSLIYHRMVYTRQTYTDNTGQSPGSDYANQTLLTDETTTDIYPMLTLSVQF